MAKRTQEEPVPDQRGENYACNNHKNDPDTGVYLVRERETKTEKGE